MDSQRRNLKFRVALAASFSVMGRENSDPQRNMDLEQDDSYTQFVSTCPSIDDDHDFLLDNDQEDACTQTDGHAQSKSVPDVNGPDMDVPYYESQDISRGSVFSVLDPELVSHSFLRRRRGQNCFKDKIPSLFKTLKEKHRENERLRHHSLNQHLRDICKNVPGSAEDGKETKVVMMQRIICYMSYLENSVKTLCSRLDVKLNQRWTVLTSSLKDIEKAGTWQKESAATQSEDSMDRTITPSISLHLKLSSPTIDSTTDPTTNDSSTSVNLPTSESCSPTIPEDDSQDAIVPDSFGLVKHDFDQESDWCTSTAEVDICESEAIDEFLSVNDDSRQCPFEYPSIALENKIIDSPCKVEWLGSPDKSPLTLQGKTSRFGIQCDLQAAEDQPSDLAPQLFVSPNKVIPTQIIKQQNNSLENTWIPVKQSKPNPACDLAEASTSGLPAKASSESSQVVPCTSGALKEQRSAFCENESDEDSFFPNDGQMVLLRQNKRKQSSPKRTPLFNISNRNQNIPFEFDESFLEASAWIKQELTDIVKEETVEKIDELDENLIAENVLEEECTKVLREASVAVQSKLDLRKSSWMNGFMMYSRVHRKGFIKSNPGFHTAIISKLMGHAWRSMTAEEQRPYTEKAKFCAQELQKLLDLNNQYQVDL